MKRQLCTVLAWPRKDTSGWPVMESQSTAVASWLPLSRLWPSVLKQTQRTQPLRWLRRSFCSAVAVLHTFTVRSKEEDAIWSPGSETYEYIKAMEERM